MPDIFISYSRKDSEQALSLAEQLRAEGLDVWIDRHGIAGAEKWATEIVEGINACSTFALLLSEHSVASENVLRELSLASEKGKRVLPIDLDRVTLPSSFEYPLAGLQRVAISDVDAILHAHKRGVAKKIKKDERKSLMILPFEDHSQEADNEWFANGIVSELISALSNVKSLRIADNQATKEFKSYRGQLVTYAHEMSIRYFVQGDVRKFGDSIKISARLLDIETGDHLWQDAIKGTMANVFEIQEQVAVKVVDGLKLHLTNEEKRKLSERGTENAEAYEIYLKACEYHHRHTKDGLRLAVQLLSEAIKLDTGYANAYQAKANALIALYRTYDRDPQLLLEAESLSKEALRINPNLLPVYYPLSMIYIHQSKMVEAERIAREFISKAPDNYFSHFSLGFYYANTDQPAKAIAAYEECVRLKPDYLTALFNLPIACHAAKDMEKSKQWSLAALPHFKRHLLLHPDDEYSRMNYGILLFFGGQADEARREAMTLKFAKDAGTLFNAACLFGLISDKEEALATFRKAIQAGYIDVRKLKEFLTNDTEGVASLAGTLEYEEVKRTVEQIEVEAEAKANA